VIHDLTQPVHASCVAVEGCGLLILGPSGAGKSSLALQIIGLGGQLVADDRVVLRPQVGQLIASAAQGLAGLVEARGLGLMRLGFVEQAPVVLVADLAQSSPSRLPQPCDIQITDVALPLIRAANRPNVAYEAMALLRVGTPPFFLNPETPVE